MPGPAESCNCLQFIVRGLQANGQVVDIGTREY